MGMFDYTIRIVFGSQRTAVEYVQWLYEDDGVVVQHQRRGFCAYREGFIPVIWLPRRPRTAIEHGTLAHEAMHAVAHMTRWAGIPINESTDEVYCHAIGHVVRRVLEKRS